MGLEKGRTLVCIDRDGTLVYDAKDHLFLGRDDEWRAQVKILPTVVSGLELLATIPNSAIFMITNQPGVAISDFPLLTVERAHEVCSHVVERLNSMGARIDGCFLCPHATPLFYAQWATAGGIHVSYDDYDWALNLE